MCVFEWKIYLSGSFRDISTRTLYDDLCKEINYTRVYFIPSWKQILVKTRVWFAKMPNQGNEIYYQFPTEISQNIDCEPSLWVYVLSGCAK